uniref:Zinc finger protein 36 n=1 Tax=Phallusia mammillata TaxID=59560 RepID=A0A6F9DYG4_9ASCI|nr:zinc finger protein 36 [Phallusia mammillata]
MKKFSINDKFLRTVSETVQHISTNRGPYICPNCNKSFLEFKQFNTHMKDQCSTSKKVYITYPSTNGDSSNKVLYLTVDQYFYGSCSGKKYKEKKLNKKFTCYSCQKVLRNNIRFMSHVRHKIETAWEDNDSINDFNICNHCYRLYDSPFHLQCHLETVHTTVPAASTCRICELNFKSEDDLLEHMQSEHTYNEMPYICKLCSYRSSFYSDLMVHFRQVHENGRSMMCPFCLCILQTPNSYLKHVLMHRKKNLRCGKCRLQFVQITDKNKHLNHDHSSVQSAVGKKCLPKKPSQYKINVEVHHPMSPSKLHTASRFLPTNKMRPLSSPPKADATNSMQSSQDLKKLCRDYTSYIPSKSDPGPLGGPIVTENNIFIRLTKDCDKSKCLECGEALGFYAHNYNKHFRKEHKCRLCQFVSHCPTATHMHILKFHSKAKSRHQKKTGKHVNSVSPFAKLCPRKHTSNEFKRKRNKSESPPAKQQETKKTSAKLSSPSALDNVEPPKKRRNKLDIDSMLEKAAQQVALENMKFLNKSTPTKQPRKQLLPKKFNLDQDTPLERIDTEELGTTNKTGKETNSKPKQFSTAGSSAVQMPSPKLKVNGSIAISENPSPSLDTSPRQSKRLKAKGVASFKKFAEETVSDEETVTDSWKDSTFSDSLGLKLQGHNFLKKTLPPSMFNPYKFSSSKMKLLKSPSPNRKQKKESSRSSEDVLKTPKPEKQQKMPGLNVSKPPLSPSSSLNQPPLPDLCFVKNSDGKILLSAKEGSNISNDHKGRPKPPTSMWFSDVTNSTFTVHWSPPLDCEVTHYSLIFKGIGLPTMQILPPEQISVKLVGLRSSTNYIVHLSTRHKTLQSDNLEGKQTTKSLRDCRTPVKVSEVINLDDDDDDDCQVIEPTTSKHDQAEINCLSDLHGTSLTKTTAVRKTPPSETLQQEDDYTNVPLFDKKSNSKLDTSEASPLDDTCVVCITNDSTTIKPASKENDKANIYLTDESKNDIIPCNKIPAQTCSHKAEGQAAVGENLKHAIKSKAYVLPYLVAQCNVSTDKLLTTTSQNHQSADKTAESRPVANLASNTENVSPSVLAVTATQCSKEPDINVGKPIINFKEDVGIALPTIDKDVEVSLSADMKNPSHVNKQTGPQNQDRSSNTSNSKEFTTSEALLDDLSAKLTDGTTSTETVKVLDTSTKTYIEAHLKNEEIDENIEKLKDLDEYLSLLGDRE